MAMTLAASLAACAGGQNSSSKADPSESSESSVSQSASETKPSEESTAETDVTSSYPREETLYYAPGQWGVQVSANPMAANPNYAAMSTADAPRPRMSMQPRDAKCAMRPRTWLGHDRFGHR